MACCRRAFLRLVLLAVVLLGAVSCGGSSDEAANPWAQPPALDVDLRVTVAPTEVALLQPVTVTLDRYRKQGVAVAFAPELDEELFVTESTTVSEEREFGDGLWQRTTLVVLPVEGPGELVLPAFVATVTATAEGEEPVAAASTPEQTLLVTSALAAEHGRDIEAPGKPFPTPFGGWGVVLAVAGVLALLAIAMVMMGRKKQRRDPLTVDVPAHVQALRELQRWRSAPRTTPAEIEAFYVGVSQVLRVYLEGRFGMHAPERTTEEFLRDLETGEVLARNHRSELDRFLSQCDLVKFAKVVPSSGDHLATFELAESFIESTRVDRAPCEVAESAAASSRAGLPA